MEEIWKDVIGYEGLYQVSNFGRVKSLGNGGSKNSKFSSERILKQLNRNGYFGVCFCKDGKKKIYLVHRLVATAFLPNPDNLPQVNHKDQCKTNNVCSNLEWCDCKYNINYGTHNKRMAESNTNHPNKSKKVMCIETGKIYPSAMQVKRELGFANTSISAVCLGKYKQAYGFHWKYID